MDLYLLLGLESGATLNDIKRAYRRLARRYHPDINPGDRMAESQFRRIADAYETLSDPDRRRRYDTSGAVESPDASGTVGFQGFDFSMSVSGASASTFGDLFSDVLQQREAQRGDGTPARGADLHHSFAFAFQEAMLGGQREVSATRLDRCGTCQGSGRVRMAQRRCEGCQGTGSVQSARGHMVFSKSCPQCQGAGWQADATCPACGGRQTVLRTDSLTINVPAGLADGARIRVPGKGHAGRNGGECGDLYITVRVEPHPLFRRDGDDLHLVVPIAIHEAALGARMEVPGIDGPVRLRVPPGTQSGQRFRLHGRGAPSARHGRRGDLVVEVKLVLPAILDERSKVLLQEFGRIHATEDVRRHLRDDHSQDGPVSKAFGGK